MLNSPPTSLLEYFVPTVGSGLHQRRPLLLPHRYRNLNPHSLSSSCTTITHESGECYHEDSGLSLGSFNLRLLIKPYTAGTPKQGHTILRKPLHSKMYDLTLRKPQALTKAPNCPVHLNLRDAWVSSHQGFGRCRSKTEISCDPRTSGCWSPSYGLGYRPYGFRV